MTPSGPILLAIESSCDDTSVAVLDGFEVLANVVHSQVMHEAFGGVVPELASRAHTEAILPTVKAALARAGKDFQDLNGIAVTQGPGLLGSLLVGHSFAKSLALSLDIPYVNVDHMEAHMLAHFLYESGVQEKPIPGFPYLCLTVSGGHTQLVRSMPGMISPSSGKLKMTRWVKPLTRPPSYYPCPIPGDPSSIDWLKRDSPHFVFPSQTCPICSLAIQD